MGLQGLFLWHSVLRGDKPRGYMGQRAGERLVGSSGRRTGCDYHYDHEHDYHYDHEHDHNHHDDYKLYYDHNYDDVLDVYDFD